MEQLTIILPAEVATQLKSAAQKIVVKPEDFLLVSLQEKLSTLDSEFINAMQYMLKKNSELYQRLA